MTTITTTRDFVIGKIDALLPRVRAELETLPEALNPEEHKKHADNVRIIGNKSHPALKKSMKALADFDRRRQLEQLDSRLTDFREFISGASDGPSVQLGEDAYHMITLEL